MRGILSRVVSVADIEDDVLLGMDILHEKNGSKTDIMMSQGAIRMHVHCIACVQNSERKTNEHKERETHRKEVHSGDTSQSHEEVW